MSGAVSPGFFSRSLDGFGGKIPFIISDLLTRVKELDGLGEKGIFRVGGASQEIAELMCVLDNGRIRDWSRWTKVNTLATTVKRYLHDLAPTEPLIPVPLVDEFLAIAVEPDPAAVVPRYKAFLERLPRAATLTLAYLMRYFSEIVHTPTSAMNSHNLGIVFAPCFFPTDPTVSMENVKALTGRQSDAIKKLIDNLDAVFDHLTDLDEFLITDEDFDTLLNRPLKSRDLKRVSELTQIRKKSVIPYVPSELIARKDFTLPNRASSEIPQ
jgi:hypothetical protein